MNINCSQGNSYIAYWLDQGPPCKLETVNICRHT